MKNMLAVLPVLVLAATGCVSTASFEVSHAKLKPPAMPQQGTLVLVPFKDARGCTNALQLGGMGDNLKPKYIAGQGRPVADILTDYFREALQNCGYQVRNEPTPGLRILEGQVDQFWLHATPWKAVCDTKVVLRVKERADGPPLWERTLTSQEDDLMIIPNAMRAAVDSLLKQATSTFASPEFAQIVRGQTTASAGP